MAVLHFQSTGLVSFIFHSFLIKKYTLRMATDKQRIMSARLNNSTTVDGSRTTENFQSTSVLMNRGQEKNQPHYIYLKYGPKEPSQSKRSISVESNRTNPDYLIMSSSLRSSICSGFPIVRGSHSRIVHNERIFQEHFENVKSDEQRRSRSFRRKKDWLGRWTEANIVRDRLMKEMVNAQKKTSTGGEAS